MELENEYTNGDCYLKFYIAIPSDSKPSKPENLKVACSSNSHPLLTWNSNDEPDKYGYVIDRAEGSGENLVWENNIATVTTTSFIDYEVSINPVFEDEVSYRISALDTQGKLSIPSSTATIGDAVLHKLPSESNGLYDFVLENAYPNPFNPSTTINYQIPKDGLVTLKVYDILGREVKTLVNEYKTKGRYEVTFDASHLASGLYIYEIKSGEYKASKKMTLVK
ncbi:MAG: T9SS type A sorting domain-containing protein [Ignavibacteriaceae bacterium]|nr:T9SS type A sorting domain-containing protein [Ignavibacteriaceae bacterium]